MFFLATKQGQSASLFLHKCLNYSCALFEHLQAKSGFTHDSFIWCPEIALNSCLLLGWVVWIVALEKIYTNVAMVIEEAVGSWLGVKVPRNSIMELCPCCLFSLLYKLIKCNLLLKSDYGFVDELANNSWYQKWFNMAHLYFGKEWSSEESQYSWTSPEMQQKPGADSGKTLKYFCNQVEL